MIAAPFVFFLFWFFKALKKTGFNGYTFLIGIYLISSLCSILIDANNYYAAHSCPNNSVGIVAPIIYISLLALCISPFKGLATLHIEPVKEITEKKLIKTCIIYVLIFLVVFITSYERMMFVLASESLANIRNEQYTGEAVSFYEHLSGVPRMIAALCSILSPSSFIMLFVFGYMMAYSKRSLWYKLLPIIGSLTPLIISINIADRSQYFYWIVLMGFSISIFYKYFPLKEKIYTIVILFVLLLFILSYFIAVSNSRFEMRNGGTEGGLILYAGQSYINFCNFVNNLTPPLFDISIIFPTVTRYIFNGHGYFELARMVEKYPNVPVSVFPTFIGVIYSVCGPFVMLVYVLVFRLVSKRILSLNKYVLYDYMALSKVWIISVVPVLGVIGYFYMNSNATIAILIWLIIAKYIKIRK